MFAKVDSILTLMDYVIVTKPLIIVIPIVQITQPAQSVKQDMDSKQSMDTKNVPLQITVLHQIQLKLPIVIFVAICTTPKMVPAHLDQLLIASSMIKVQILVANVVQITTQIVMHAKPQAIKTVSIPWTILTVVYVILITMLKLMEAAKKLVKKLYQIVLNIAQKLQIT